VKEAFFANVNHSQICSPNKQVFTRSNEGIVSCPRKQRELLMGLKLDYNQTRNPNVPNFPSF